MRERDKSMETSNAPSSASTDQMGDKIKRAREAAAMTLQDMVGELAGVGVKMSMSTLSRSEAGIRSFKRAQLEAIAGLLAARDVPLGRPMCGEDDADVEGCPGPATPAGWAPPGGSRV